MAIACDESPRPCCPRFQIRIWPRISVTHLVRWSTFIKGKPSRSDAHRRDLTDEREATFTLPQGTPPTDRGRLTGHAAGDMREGKGHERNSFGREFSKWAIQEQADRDVV